MRSSRYTDIWSQKQTSLAMKDVNLRGSSTQETTPRIYSFATEDFITEMEFRKNGASRNTARAQRFLRILYGKFFTSSSHNFGLASSTFLGVDTAKVCSIFK